MYTYIQQNIGHPAPVELMCHVKHENKHEGAMLMIV